jgi:hypothetical protein
MAVGNKTYPEFLECWQHVSFRTSSTTANIRSEP